MSYLAMSSLAIHDPYFKARLSMCVSEQAKAYVDDEDPAYSLLADQAIGSNASVTDQLLPLVATEPDMTSDASDGQILSAVQHLWPIVGARLVPPPPMPPVEMP